MALYFEDRKRTGTFCLNVCRGNVMKDVDVAIILFQLAVASGHPRVPCVLCERLEARDICMHGPIIPGPGSQEATLEPWAALSGPFSPLVPGWRTAAAEGNSRSSSFEDFDPRWLPSFGGRSILLRLASLLFFLLHSS